MLDIRLILSVLRFHKVGVTLVILQIALTFAIVANVSSISAQLYALMSRPSGMTVMQNIGVESIAVGNDFNAQSTLTQDLDILRAIPGVIDATVISEIPLGPSADVPFLISESEKHGKIESRGYMFFGDEHALPTLGLKLVAGRNFSAVEINNFNLVDFSGGEGVTPLVVSQRWADVLFPDGDALGKKIKTSSGPADIVGIVERMQGAWADWEGFDRVAIYPARLLDKRLVYMLQTEKGKRAQVMGQIENKLYEADDRRVIHSVKGQDEYLNDQYKNHSALLTSLMIMAIILSGFAAFGIYALTKFNITRQTRQIGIKRALGATRGDVVAYYLFENFVISVTGLLIGACFIAGLNTYLVNNYDISKLDWIYVPIVAGVYILIGLIAVYFPARKAAAASPVAAIRSS